MKKMVLLAGFILIGVAGLAPAEVSAPIGTEGAQPGAKPAIPIPQAKGKRAKAPSKTRKHKAFS